MQADRAGARVNHDHAHVTGVGEGTRRVKRRPGFQAVPQVLVKPVRLEVRQPGQVGDRDGRGLVAANAGGAFDEFHIVRIGLELAGRDLA